MERTGIKRTNFVRMDNNKNNLSALLESAWKYEAAGKLSEAVEQLSIALEQGADPLICISAISRISNDMGENIEALKLLETKANFSDAAISREYARAYSIIDNVISPIVYQKRGENTEEYKYI